MSEFEQRRRKVSERVSESRKQAIDCALITSLPNLRYFFNYGGRSYERFCCGLISKDGTKGALVVPKLDFGKTKKSHVDNVFAWSDNEGYKDSLLAAIGSIGTNDDGIVIGCESSLTLDLMDQFKGPVRTKSFVPINEEISELRLLKSDQEIDSFRDSARRLSRAYRSFPEIIRQGMTEAEAGFEIMKIMSEMGLEVSDPPLVQSGENSAIPHSTPGKRKIRNGDMLVIDSSSPNKDGYFSDYTRTYIVGKPSARQKEIFEIVKRAEAEGIKASKIGTPAEEVDHAARSVIQSEGYAEFFTHRTGHGLGLEVHEPPYLRSGNSEELKEGMIFTVEPGVYIPGKFGVRIEDNMVLARSKAENVTKLSHDLIEI